MRDLETIFGLEDGSASWLLARTIAAAADVNEMEDDVWLLELDEHDAESLGTDTDVVAILAGEHLILEVGAPGQPQEVHAGRIVPEVFEADPALAIVRLLLEIELEGEDAA